MASVHCMWKCQVWRPNTSEGPLPISRVRDQSRNQSRGSAALDDFTEGFFSHSLSLFVFFHTVSSLSLIGQDDGQSRSRYLQRPPQPHCIMGGGKGILKKSVWQTSWRRYRSTASWTGRLETPGWRRLYTIFTAGWSVGRWWIWFLTETRRHKHKSEKEIELGRDSSEEKKTTKNPFAAWNSVIEIFGAWKTPTLCFSFFFFVFTLWKKLTVRPFMTSIQICTSASRRIEKQRVVAAAK